MDPLFVFLLAAASVVTLVGLTTAFLAGHTHARLKIADWLRMPTARRPRHLVLPDAAILVLALVFSQLLFISISTDPATPVLSRLVGGAELVAVVIWYGGLAWRLRPG